MKVAISNIAWQVEEEEAIAIIMQELDIKGVEIAPTKIWESPLTIADGEIELYRNFWQSRGIQIVAMQALLFGRPDLTIFQDAQKRKETFEYLSGMIQLGSKLGARTLVFGSPKNRKISNIELQEAEEIALSFFYELGEVAKKNGIIFCIEPNPKAYSCDFVINSSQGLELVNKTNNEGFGLHLDAAGMTLSEEVIELALKRCFSRLCHFHISEPYLVPVGEGGVDHQTFANTLANLNYDGWTSIEMRAQSPNLNSFNIAKMLRLAIKYYG
ncbi:sugar phosphate isomerase/epimerase [Synechococcus sp. PCC 7336]|uniref:sugar phosphate isomerase/epimerase family protein n=1 Tax=Synechococcus sp. PCC 7336 TaxID=195250 RepID=UPI000348A164|nr:sugar phosphate isomerase/epimerase family protein [Synechococcus sp. PCC 7336]